MGQGKLLSDPGYHIFLRLIFSLVQIEALITLTLYQVTCDRWSYEVDKVPALTNTQFSIHEIRVFGWAMLRVLRALQSFILTLTS